MRELLELQTGQVAFISGLMAGFSLSMAAHVLRYGIRSRSAQAVFLLFLLSSLLFLVALYVDVRLSIELAGIDTLPQSVVQDVIQVRHVGTGSATLALIVFILATAVMSWLVTPMVGLFGTLLTGLTLYVLWTLWQHINAVAMALDRLP